jgi:hypothetical protein
LINLLLLLWIFYFAWHFFKSLLQSPFCNFLFHSSSSHSISRGYGYMITK